MNQELKVMYNLQKNGGMGFRGGGPAEDVNQQPILRINLLK